MKDAEANGGHNFMDAAYEVAAKYGLIQIFTNGNRQFQNPYYRAAYAYYNPEAEKYWIAADGVDVDAEGNEKIMGWGLDYTGTGTPSGGNAYNRSGIAKRWGIARLPTLMVQVSAQQLARHQRAQLAERPMQPRVLSVPLGFFCSGSGRMKPKSARAQRSGSPTQVPSAAKSPPMVSGRR